MAFVRVFLCCLMLVKVVVFRHLVPVSAVSHHKSVGPSSPVSTKSSVPATSTMLPRFSLLMVPKIKMDPPYHLSVETLHVSAIVWRLIPGLTSTPALLVPKPVHADQDSLYCKVCFNWEHCVCVCVCVPK